MKVVVHNHLSRNIGRFRATAAVRDHKHDCHCGGACDDCRKHSQLRLARDNGYVKGELGIDVTYVKGGYGRPKTTETRHYTVSGVLIDPRGYAPSAPFVADQLRKQPEHQRMVKSGWTAEHAEGYYKREQRDVGEVV